AMIQIAAIIYSFAVVTMKEAWWRWVAILECVEVTSIVLFALRSEIAAPLELAYIAPFTSQAATIGVIFFTSKGIESKSIPKHMADHLLTGLVVILVSTSVLVLPLSGLYTRLMLTQWVLFMLSSTVGYRLPDSSSPTGGDSEIALTPNRQLNFSSLADNSPWLQLDGRQSLSAGPILLPPVATISSNQLSCS
ncbi:hypothetical protein B0T10DRAFT_411430, partial [Thelonectria olida]